MIFRRFIKVITVINVISVIIGITVFGGFWYARNFFVTGNPVYPISIFGLPGVKDWALEIPAWKAILNYPGSFATAVLSEYLGWSLLGVYLFFKKGNSELINKLLLLFLGNLLVYLLLPNGASYRVHVSNLRYSYPVFLPFLLSIFLIAKEYKWEKYLSLFALANILFALQFPYHPKLLIIYIPLAFVIWRRRV